MSLVHADAMTVRPPNHLYKALDARQTVVLKIVRVPAVCPRSYRVTEDFRQDFNQKHVRTPPLILSSRTGLSQRRVANII